jgi:hypothetical protein
MVQNVIHKIPFGYSFRSWQDNQYKTLKLTRQPIKHVWPPSVYLVCLILAGAEISASAEWKEIAVNLATAPCDLHNLVVTLPEKSTI